MGLVAVSLLSAIVGGLISLATSYFSNIQRYKQNVIKQNSDHDYDLVEQDSEHTHDR